MFSDTKQGRMTPIVFLLLFVTPLISVYKYVRIRIVIFHKSPLSLSIYLSILYTCLSIIMSYGSIHSLLQSNGTEQDDDALTKTKKKKTSTPFLVIFTIVSTLFFGVGVGLSFGYYTSKKRLFKMNTNVDETFDTRCPSSMEQQDLVEKSQKTLEFMNEFFFNKDSEGVESPLLSFSLGPSSSRSKLKHLLYLNRP